MNQQATITKNPTIEPMTDGQARAYMDTTLMINGLTPLRGRIISRLHRRDYTREQVLANFAAGMRSAMYDARDAALAEAAEMIDAATQNRPGVSPSEVAHDARQAVRFAAYVSANY